MLDHRYLIPAIRNLKNLTSVIESQLSLHLEKAKEIGSYPDFGLYIQNTNPWFLAVRCGSIGQKGHGGHAHNDQLSFELSVNEMAMIIDPGTYVYTPLPVERRCFRSTAMHNTMSIVGKEQNKDGGLFQLTDKAKPIVAKFQKDLFIGEHQGFGSTHRRTLKVSSQYIEGIDECDESPKQISFHFAPGWKGQINHQITEWKWGSKLVRISTDQGDWEIVQGEYSSSYGEKECSSVLRLASTSKRVVWKIETFS
jgi:hypothetical protein